MTKNWKADDLIKIDDGALMRLLSNANSVAKREKSKLLEPAVALIPLIEAELVRRAASRPISRKSERRAPKSEKGRIERQYADAIVDLVVSLNTRFDLSPETATRLSRGFSKFAARNPLGKNGDALVGGSKLAGKLPIHRYTAYRVRDETVLLVVILEKDEPVSNIKFIVQAPDRLLTDPQPLSSIRSVMDVEKSLAKQEVGQLYYDFTTAAQFYEKVIALIAPRRMEAF